MFKNPRLLTDLCVVQENDIARIDFALLKVSAALNYITRYTEYVNCLSVRIPEAYSYVHHFSPFRSGSHFLSL